jgi:predicted nucleotidyltransferase
MRMPSGADAHCSVRAICVFGSIARGDYRPDSDVDVFVEVAVADVQAPAVVEGDIAFRIDAVNLENRLRDIQTDCANLAHGRLPSMWLRFDATTLWHFDAAEWAPSTASFSTDAFSTPADQCPLLHQ